MGLICTSHLSIPFIFILSMYGLIGSALELTITRIPVVRLQVVNPGPPRCNVYVRSTVARKKHDLLRETMLPTEDWYVFYFMLQNHSINSRIHMNTYHTTTFDFWGPLYRKEIWWIYPIPYHHARSPFPSSFHWLIDSWQSDSYFWQVMAMDNDKC